MDTLHDIPNFPGYKIDTNGNIFSYWTTHLVHIKKHRGFVSSEVAIGDVLRKRKSFIMSNGYSGISLRKGGRSYTKTVHRIFAKIFIPNLEHKSYVCHKNGCRSDNRIENLYWGTAKENSFDTNKHGRRIMGEYMHNAQLNTKKVKLFRLLNGTFGWSCAKISKIWNVKRKTVWKAVTKRTWGWLE